ncbi:hypothetical protein LCGC14_2426870 [marine sediment metagenome]|uniref:Uncharacterized protein n=1 Tax=marine sediment metagenome TaxID=412755 RepID=A0A0F9EH77_9ZZZZ
MPPVRDEKRRARGPDIMAEPDIRRAASRVFAERISSGSATCIPGVCDKNYCRHAPDCPWKRTIDEIYRIGRELDDEPSTHAD